MRMSLAPVVGAVVLVVLSAAPPSLATDPGDSLNWAFGNTGYAAGDVALGLRNGLAFPVIYDNAGGNGQIITLLPVANPMTMTNWHEIASNLSLGNEIRAASSAGGRVAFVGDIGGGVVSTLPTGTFIGLNANVRAVAFMPGGSLVTATDNAVSAAGGFPGSGIRDIAVSAFGDVGVVSFSNDYAQFSPLTGTWGTATFPTQFDPNSASITFDTLGVPHVVARDGGDAVAFDFNTSTGQWDSTQLTNNGSVFSNAMAIVADSLGTVGTAFVDIDKLYYAYKRGFDPWTVVPVLDNVDSLRVGIAYDYNDFPVIAYSAMGTVHLAYDPPSAAVPEPGSIALFAAGGLFMLRRRPRRPRRPRPC